MPAIILVRTQDNPVPDAPGKWYGGQCVTAVEQKPEYEQHFFGYQEMPVRFDQRIAVQALNGRNPNSYKKFNSFQMLTAGVIDVGLNNLTVEVGDVVVRQSDGIFVNYGSNFQSQVDVTGSDNLVFDNERVQLNIKVKAQTGPTVEEGVNGFQQFEITDFTLEQAQAYVQPVFEDGPPVPGEPLQEPTQVLVSRSKYKVSQAGMDALAANDGWLEGPWSTFESYFEDQYP